MILCATQSGEPHGIGAFSKGESKFFLQKAKAEAPPESAVPLLRKGEWPGFLDWGGGEAIPQE